MADYIVHKAIELDKINKKNRELVDQRRAWIISPKYDGCHAVFCFDRGQHIVTYSRTGGHVHSMPHVARGLLLAYPFLSSGRWAICGEAWALGKEFNEISGLFRRQSPSPELNFVPFDCVPFEYNMETTSFPPVHLGYMLGQVSMVYADRLMMIANPKPLLGDSILKPRYIAVDGDLPHVKQLADQEAERNKRSSTGAYDGAVLAWANGLYIVGDGKGGEFIKCKPLLSESVRVNALFPDMGDKTGKNTLALGFELAGKQQKVSTGLTQQQVDDFIRDNSLILGQTIEVEAMGITVNGFLREPRFKGIRNDA